MNTVGVIGRLTRDAETRTVGDKTVAAFAIASNYYKKGAGERNEEASFFDVEQWDSKILQYLKKGQQVAVLGQLRQERWEKDGQKHSRIKIMAREIQLLGAKSGTGSGGGSAAEGDDDDIPF
jgi:single-strand DNA-binding protein